MSDVFLPKMLTDDCVYWPPVGTGQDGRSTLFGEAVPARCRWAEKNEQFMSKLGEVQVSSAVVNTDADMEIGGALFHGEIGDLSNPSSAGGSEGLPEGAWEIKGWKRIPDFRGRKFVRAAML